jgi:predicted transcriptional regulator
MVSHQERSKIQHRKKILDIIEEKHPTFKELRDEAQLSNPVLSKYLRTLVEEGIIERQFAGARREFVLTDKGKGQEQLLREYVAKAFQVVKDLSSDYPAADALLELSKLAKGDPKFFNELVQWMSDYMALMASDESRQWIYRHGESGTNRLRSELTKRITAYVKENPQPEKSRELIGLLQILLNTTREVVSGRGIEH